MRNILKNTNKIKMETLSKMNLSLKLRLGLSVK
jgi:hypothetical protein